MPPASAAETDTTVRRPCRLLDSRTRGALRSLTTTGGASGESVAPGAGDATPGRTNGSDRSLMFPASSKAATS